MNLSTLPMSSELFQPAKIVLADFDEMRLELQSPD
jgi:hypothetical protein